MKKRWLLLPSALAASLAVAPNVVGGIVSDRIYQPPTTPLTLEGLSPGAGFVDVTTVDGLALKGILVRPRPGMPLLLVFHGNASSAAGVVHWFAPLIGQGYGVLAAEYRGYSAMPGTPSELGFERDADAFNARARVEAKGSPLWLVGHSLGGGVALNLAMRQRFDTVVTIGTFTSIRAMAPGIARAFVPDAYRNATNVPRLYDPYILIHGTADSVVPAQMGSALHTAAGNAKRVGASIVLPGEGHQPDARKLLIAFDAVKEWRTTGRWNASTLSDDLRLVPFGQTRPINP